MYTGFRPTEAVTGIIVEIMAEVLSILGMATKEIQEGRISMSFPVDSYLEVDLRLEKYIKKLVGWAGTPVEDAVGRLDRLMQEEALMAAAETLATTHRIDKGIKGVQEDLEGVDQGIQTVGLAVQGIDNKMQDVKEELMGVGNKVSSIIEGIVHLLSWPIIF